MKRFLLFSFMLLLNTGWVFGQQCAGIIGLPPSICAGVDVNLRADGPTPATYSWTLPTGVTLVSGTLTGSAITVRWGNGSPGSPNPYNSVVTCNYTSAICNLSLSKTVAVSKQPTIAPSDNPSTLPQSVCLNAPVTALAVTAGGASPFTYKWYSNTTSSNTGGTLMSGATNSSFTPPSSVVGTKYYYVIVTGASGSCTKTSNVSGAITVADVTITSQPSTSGQSVCLNASLTALSVTASGASPLTYQWYSNTTSSSTGGTLVSGAASSSFTLPTSVAGTKYYYVVVTGNGACSKTSNVSGEITVADITITGQPSASDQSVCLNASSTALSVTASGPSPLTYQWYSNTTSSNTGGTLVSGATNSSLTPSSSSVGTKYYYVIVTGNGTCTKTSNVSGAIAVADVIITGHPSTSGQSVCLNESLPALSVTASGTSPFTYQWYSNTTSSNTGGTLISGATNSSFTPPTSTPGIEYYYVIVTGNAACSKTSNVSGELTVGVCTEALSFSNDFVNIPNHSTLNFGTGNFTMEVYVNLTAASGIATVLSKRTFVDEEQDSDGFLLGFYEGSPFIQLQGTLGSSNIHPATGAINFSDGGCHHLAVRRSGATISFFVDGVFLSNGNFTSSRDISSTGNLKMGSDVPTTTPFPGWIGEVRIWNIALTDTQIQNNLGLDLSPQTGLIAYYDMNDMAGSQTLTDLSANGNNGTLGNSASADSDDPAWLTPAQVGICAVSGNFRKRTLQRGEVFIFKGDSVKGEASLNTRVFPNPSGKFVTVELPEAVKRPTAITFFDKMGNESMKTTIKQGENRKIVYVGDLPDGVYIVRVRTSQGTLQKKIVILKE